MFLDEFFPIWMKVYLTVLGCVFSVCFWGVCGVFYILEGQKGD